MNKRMNILIGIVIAFVMLICVVLFSITNAISDTYNETVIPLKEMVGERVVINDDTLQIINYSTIDEILILENGTKIDINFAQKNKIETYK